MFNVGGPEIMVVLLVALVVLGPEQLPKAMRTFGNVMAQVRKVSSGFQDEMRSAMNTLDVTSVTREASKPTPSGPTPSTAPTSQGSTESDRTPAAAQPGGKVDGAQEDGPSAPAIDPVSDRPGISSADRAAG